MDITIKNLQTKIPLRLPRIKKTVRRALGHLRILDAEVSIVFVSPQRMRTLNRNYMRHDYVTDVLTFDFNRGSKLRSQGLGLVCAEIVICPSAAVMNAKNFQTTLQKEIELYVIHGILHVMGYKDHSPGDIARMRQKEAELIKRLQIG